MIFKSIGMLLVSKSGLVGGNAVGMFHHYCFDLLLLNISSIFMENNNVVAFLFPFHISMPLANLWLIRLQG